MTIAVPWVRTLEELLELLESLAAVPGEADALSELDHGLQCAYELSRVRPDDEELQIAGLVHDVGHRFGSAAGQSAAGESAAGESAAGESAAGESAAGQSAAGHSDAEHGALGANCVGPLLGARVAGLVEAHVPAKRYLVTTDPAYGAVLSPCSVVSLERQGGGMTPREVAEFEAGPYASDATVLRRADDAAKVPARSVPALHVWIPLLRQMAAAR